MTTSLFSDEPSRCPECGAPSPLPLLYGPSSEEMRAAAQLGQIALSDTPMTDPPHQWRCHDPRCGLEF